VKKWCGVQVLWSDISGLVGEHEMRSDRGRERMRQDDDRVERVGWTVKSS